MNTFIHADIFFFVTTIAVVVVAIALTVALVYLAKVLSDLKSITEQIREEAMLFREDIKDVRNEVRREGFRIERLLNIFRIITKRKSSRSKSSGDKK